MERKTVTFSIEKETWRKIRRIAALRRTSVSELLVKALEELVEQADDYGAARERHLQQLEQGVDLGTRGMRLAQREELHKRGACYGHI